MKVSINIPFWYTKEDRLNNLKITYHLLKGLSDYLITKGIDISINVFEFSFDKQYFEEAVYLPVEGEFNKALKLNTALKYLKENNKPDIVSFNDSDCFVDRVDYDNVYNVIKGFNKKHYYCNNFIKVSPDTKINLEKLEIDRKFIAYRFMGGLLQALGGMWFADFDTIYEIGGFDERYVNWGGEDEDIGKRLILKNITPKILPYRSYHLHHEVAPTKKLNNEEQLNILKNDNTIVRKTLLNNYTI
jgi:hypothetical protein